MLKAIGVSIPGRIMLGSFVVDWAKACIVAREEANSDSAGWNREDKSEGGLLMPWMGLLGDAEKQRVLCSWSV